MQLTASTSESGGLTRKCHGLGLSAVYAITELPLILSGDGLFM